MKAIHILLPCVLLMPASYAHGQQPEYFKDLVMVPENRCSAYERRDYPYPQSVEPRIIEALGSVYGPYTGECFSSKRETDIEHIVAVSEAHDSGLCAAGPATRKAFARDLLNLTLASPRVNRHLKSAKDAAEWTPDKNRCWFAQRTIDVRRKYGLTIDRREAEAVRAILSRCRSTEMVIAPCAGSQSTAGDPPLRKSKRPESAAEKNVDAPARRENAIDATAVEAPAVDVQARRENAAEKNIDAPARRENAIDAPAVEAVEAPAWLERVAAKIVDARAWLENAAEKNAGALARWDDNNNGRITCAEARKHRIAPVSRGHPAYRYMNDRDKDGIVCD